MSDRILKEKIEFTLIEIQKQQHLIHNFDCMV